MARYFFYFSSTHKGVERVRHLAEDSPILGTKAPLGVAHVK